MTMMTMTETRMRKRVTGNNSTSRLDCICDPFRLSDGDRMLFLSLGFGVLVDRAER